MSLIASACLRAMEGSIACMWTLGEACSVTIRLTVSCLRVCAYPPMLTVFTVTAVHRLQCSRLRNIEYRTRRASVHCFFRSTNRHNGYISKNSATSREVVTVVLLPVVSVVS